jgi:hypothetical protein
MKQDIYGGFVYYHLFTGYEWAGLLISSCDGLFSCSILRGWGSQCVCNFSSSSVTTSMIKVHNRVMTSAHFVDDKHLLFVDVPVVREHQDRGLLHMHPIYPLSPRSVMILRQICEFITILVPLSYSGNVSIVLTWYLISTKEMEGENYSPSHLQHSQKKRKIGHVEV